MTVLSGLPTQNWNLYSSIPWATVLMLIRLDLLQLQYQVLAQSELYSRDWHVISMMSDNLMHGLDTRTAVLNKQSSPFPYLTKPPIKISFNLYSWYSCLYKCSFSQNASKRLLRQFWLNFWLSILPCVYVITSVIAWNSDLLLATKQYDMNFPSCLLSVLISAYS